MMRARTLSASARASASRSCRLSGDCVGGEVRERPGSAASQTLLIGRRLWNQAATDESVRDPSCVEQICQRCEAGIATFGPRLRGFLGGRCPVCPTGGNERAAAVRKHHQQQQCAAALEGRHNRQRPALKRMPLSQDRHCTRNVAEMGSLWQLPSTAWTIAGSCASWNIVSRTGGSCA